MKKNLFLLATILLFFVSCEGPAGRDGVDGLDGEGVNWKIVTYTVKSSDWQLKGDVDALNSYYMYEFNENSLTDFIYENRNVFGYMVQNAGQSSEVQTPLPYVVPYGESSNGSDNLWSEYYTFDFMPGSIAFYAHYTDFYTGNKPPTCTFRIVMNW